jgi:glutamate formiminotransferase/formiminotetrahydrofolate cyclodeaminase
VIECVANISEGRRTAIIEEMVAVLRSRGALVLDCHSDIDHHRSVITFAGDAQSLSDAVAGLARCATARIDVRRHRGVHPRIGALDVVPFVPLAEATLDECVALAACAGERLARECGLPVYLYGRAATGDNRRSLAGIRCGGLDRLAERMAEGFLPDYGPPRLHETAGATAVGAREPLVAYNVQLESRDLQLARRIATSVRERNGGLPGVQALGLWLESRGCVQVSMNLTRPEETSVCEAFEAVAAHAESAGASVRDSEIVGLAPRAAVGGCTSATLRLADDIEAHLLEARLEAV